MSVRRSLLLTSVGGPKEEITGEAAGDLHADRAPMRLGEADSVLFQPGPHSAKPAKNFVQLRGISGEISGGPKADVLRQPPAWTAFSSLAEAVSFPSSLHGAWSGEGWGLPAQFL